MDINPPPPQSTTTNCPTPVWLAWEDAELVTLPGLHRPSVVYESGILPTPCKRWACEHCGRGKRAEALTLIKAGTAHGLSCRPSSPLRLLTLTYPAGVNRSFDRRADVLAASQDFRRLVQTWRRSGRVLEYARVLERTRAGRIHIHAITWGDYIAKCTDAGRRARGLPSGRGSGSPCYCTDARPCVQRMAWAAGFGWVEVRAIRSPARAAAYVAKYLGKQGSSWWPAYARRVAYSRRWADGLTLGRIHESWVADVIRRLAALGRLDETIPATATWLGVVPDPGQYRFRPRPPPGVDHATGEILPEALVAAGR